TAGKGLSIITEWQPAREKSSWRMSHGRDYACDRAKVLKRKGYAFLRCAIRFSQSSARTPKLKPSAAQNTARAPSDAIRKFQRTLAGKPAGTSSTAGRAAAANAVIRTKTAAQARPPFHGPSLATKNGASIAARIMVRSEIASIPK